jgi:DNA polymerase I-like protein with 3'-5' exonuclease and polymerase domains
VKHKCTVIAQFHPAASLHQPRLLATMLNDWEYLPSKADANYVIVEDKEPVGTLNNLTSLDVENDEHGQIGQWSIAYRDLSGQLTVHPYQGAKPELLVPGKVVFHNAKYDLRVLRANGMPTPKPENVLDTMIAAYCLGLGRQEPRDTGKSGDNLVGGLGLKYLARRHLGMRMKTWQEVSGHPELIPEYNAADSVATYLLFEKWKPILPQHFWDIDMPLLDVLMTMEDRGIKVDPEFLKSYAEEIDGHLDEIKKDLPLNPYATKEVAKYVYETLGYPVTRRTDTGQPSVEKELLETIDDPIIRRILEYKEFYQERKTYLGSYVNRLDIDNRIHCEFKQTSTSTGRLSAARPNLQNVTKDTSTHPSKLRDLFVADGGKILVRADWSQIELRVFAALAQDERMLKALTSGEDIHQVTADMLGVSRDDAKINNFLTLYGGTPWAISREFHIPIDKARAFQKDYYAKFPGVKKYMEEQRARAIEERKVYNYYGRCCRLDGMFSDDWKTKEDDIRLAINMPIQGCLPSDTKVLTPNGWESIGILSEKSVVWTGEKWATATKLNRGVATRLRLYLSDGRTFDCDNRHYLLVQDSTYPRWEAVENLTNKIPLVRDCGQDWGRDLNKEEDWYWVGRFIGDGWLGQIGWKIAFGHTPDELDAVIRLEKWLQTKPIKGETNSSIGYYRDTDKKGNVSVRGNTKAGRRLWIDLGIKERWRSRTKRIPEIIFVLDSKRRKSFLKGYFDADGYEGVRSQRYCSSNRLLLEDTLRLMQTVGQTGQITETRNHGNTWFNLYIHKVAHPLYVQSIECCNDEEMFTLSVDDEHHSFSTEGIISKNTAGEIVKRAMIRLHQDHKAPMILQVHDELLFEVPEAEGKEYALWLKDYLPSLTEINGMKFPVEVSTGKTWLEAMKKERKL